MRDIKFRAYAQADKTWHYWDVYGEYPEGVYGGLSYPQQYTGLKDKNGQEIYEGDLLTQRSYKTIYLVDFNNENYGHVMGWNLLEYGYFKDGIFSECEKVEYSNSNTVNYPVSEYYYGECPTDKDKPNPYYEVVGNIFEGVDK